jgi:hypothetical protein
MNAALYFELVDAVARADGQAGLAEVAERIAATPMHPLERRVLDRAIRSRSEALALQMQLKGPVAVRAAQVEAKSLAAGG